MQNPPPEIDLRTLSKGYDYGSTEDKERSLYAFNSLKTSSSGGPAARDVDVSIPGKEGEEIIYCKVTDRIPGFTQIYKFHSPDGGTLLTLDVCGWYGNCGSYTIYFRSQNWAWHLEKSLKKRRAARIIRYVLFRQKMVHGKGHVSFALPRRDREYRVLTTCLNSIRAKKVDTLKNGNSNNIIDIYSYVLPLSRPKL